MEAYARVTRNTDGAPHNRGAWKLTVFDGDNEPLMKLAYDHTLVGGISFETHMLLRLRDLGYDASTDNCLYVGDGLLITQLRRID